MMQTKYVTLKIINMKLVNNKPLNIINMKLLTEEMVQDALKELGLTEEQLVKDDVQVSDKIMEHYDCRISDRWEEQDLYIYEESTADGYSAYICTNNPNSICINEDVYQYEHNSEVTNRLEDAIPVSYTHLTLPTTPYV